MAFDSLPTAQNESTRRSVLASVALGIIGLSSASTVFRPTELGAALLRCLPTYRSACDGEAMDSAYEECEVILAAIAERPITSLSHLVDNAIAATFMEHHGVFDDTHHARIVGYLLRVAGIEERSCAL